MCTLFYPFTHLHPKETNVNLFKCHRKRNNINWFTGTITLVPFFNFFSYHDHFVSVLLGLSRIFFLHFLFIQTRIYKHITFLHLAHIYKRGEFLYIRKIYKHKKTSTYLNIYVLYIQTFHQHIFLREIRYRNKTLFNFGLLIEHYFVD